jgi:hypothetical protein
VILPPLVFPGLSFVRAFLIFIHFIFLFNKQMVIICMKAESFIWKQNILDKTITTFGFTVTQPHLTPTILLIYFIFYNILISLKTSELLSI